MPENTTEIAFLREIFPELGEVTFGSIKPNVFQLKQDAVGFLKTWVSQEGPLPDGRPIETRTTSISDYEALAIVKQWLMGRIKEHAKFDLLGEDDAGQPIAVVTSHADDRDVYHRTGATVIEALYEAWLACEEYVK